MDWPTVAEALNEPPVSSKEVADVLDSKIVQDINQSTLAELKIQQMFLLTIALIVIVIIGFAAMWSKLNSIAGMIPSGI